MNRSRRAVSFLTLVCAAAACGESNNDALGSYSFGAAVGALEAAIAACGKERATCEQSDTDATVETACEDAFSICRDAASEATKAGLEHGVSACRTDLKSCREAATTEDDRAVCKDELAACVAEGHPDVGRKGSADGGLMISERNPNAPCITSLRECIASDAEAKGCAQEVRTCLTGSMSARQNGHRPADAGGGKPDGVGGGKPDGVGGGKPSDDVTTDAGTSADAGTTTSGAAEPAGKPDSVGGGKPDGVGGGKPDGVGR